MEGPGPKPGEPDRSPFPSVSLPDEVKVVCEQNKAIYLRQWLSPLASLSTLLETPKDSKKGVEIKDSKNLNTSLLSALWHF